jgi:nitrogen fixation protein FixH
MSATSSNRPSDPTPDSVALAAYNKKRGRFVPWVIVAFYFSFMSALIGFVFIAYAHPPAESTAEAYDKGLSYNSTLEKADIQTRLGWKSTTAYADKRVRFVFRDAADRPIVGAKVKAWFVHPGKPGDDRSYDLPEAGPGIYQTNAALPAAGLWTIHITAARGGDQFQAVTMIEAP